MLYLKHLNIFLLFLLSLCLMKSQIEAQTTTITWKQLSPATSPPPRVYASMAFDPKSGNLVLFGGTNGTTKFNDTWLWNGTTWSNPSNGTPPPARSNAAMAFDSRSGQLILVGGSGNKGPLNDTWAWNEKKQSWNQLFPETSPPAFATCVMAFDPATQWLVLFGNQTTAFEATWIWTGVDWNTSSFIIGPSSRYNPSMALDANPNINQIILFGGQDEGNQAHFFNDTYSWSFADTEWEIKNPQTSPPPRASASFAFDAATNQLILFGGENNTTIFNDTWNWNGSNWEQLFPAVSPSARFGAAMAFDAVTGQLILFGGSTSNNIAPLGDTWQLVSNPSVSSLNPNNGPATGGTPVTITGVNFTGATAVNFGPMHPSPKFLVVNDNEIFARAPSGRGIVDVTVTTPNGTSLTSPADQFTYLPVVTGLSPDTGPESGGTCVMISGVEFTGATAVNFGDAPAASFTVCSDTLIAAVSPPEIPGKPDVPVSVTTPLGTSSLIVTLFVYKPSICSGQQTNIHLSSHFADTKGGFTWTVEQFNVKGACDGSGDVIRQKVTAIADAPGKVIYTVRRKANARASNDKPVKITLLVSPRPVATAIPSQETICSGQTTHIQLRSNIPNTGFFIKVVEHNVIGASDDFADTIQQTLFATSNVPGTAVYTVTPVANGCTGKPITVTVTVNPAPVATASPTTEAIASGQPTNIQLSSSIPGTTFNWTVFERNVTGASAGSGNAILQTLTAAGTTPGTVIYTITPTVNGCVGNPITVTVTVQPPLAPPTHFRGKVKVRECHQDHSSSSSESGSCRRDIIHVLTWKASPDLSVTEYKLFQGERLIRTIPASGPFKVRLRHRSRHKCYTYRLVTVNAQGEQSQPSVVTLPKRCKSHH